jgi:hypothetical protein
MVQGKINQDRAQYSSKGCQKRINCLLGRIQVSAGQTALGYLHGSDAEEENHEQLIGQKMKAERSDEGIIVELMIAVRVEVGPEQSNNDPRNERY